MGTGFNESPGHRLAKKRYQFRSLISSAKESGDRHFPFLYMQISHRLLTLHFFLNDNSPDGFINQTISCLSFYTGFIWCGTLFYLSTRYLFSIKLYTMLRLALIFLVIAIIAGIFGFTGIAATSASIAKVIFYIFLVLFILGLLLGYTVFKK